MYCTTSIEKNLESFFSLESLANQEFGPYSPHPRIFCTTKRGRRKKLGLAVSMGNSIRHDGDSLRQPYPHAHSSYEEWCPPPLTPSSALSSSGIVDGDGGVGTGTTSSHSTRLETVISSVDHSLTPACWTVLVATRPRTTADHGLIKLDLTDLQGSLDPDSLGAPTLRITKL
jgi:hypothetical protein